MPVVYPPTCGPHAQGGKEKNTAKAVLHQYFAAAGGDERGQMAMAYRHLHGRGEPGCRVQVWD